MFRASAADEARAMGVTGYARNLPDGSVEIVAEGRPEFLRMLAAWAVVGPPHARVDKVEEAWEPFVGDFEEFRVR
jgi:acylphosphatase